MNVSIEGVRIRFTWGNRDNEDVKMVRDFFLKLTRQGWLAAMHIGEYSRILEFKAEYGELWFILLSEGGW